MCINLSEIKNSLYNSVDILHKHEIFLSRCVDLAQLPGAQVSPNPRVGSVLVYEGRIIGEGYHHRHGAAHAEVNCLASVKAVDRHLISSATLYVSLEPCCIHGRTPPCTDLIRRAKIPRVIIGQLDQTAEVSGSGVRQLREAGISVEAYPDFIPARRLVAPRQLYAAHERPYVLLKYARSVDGIMAPAGQQSYWITSPISRRMVHFWRSRTTAIVVGAATVLADNPRLDTRYYPGPSPLTVVLDPRGHINHERWQIFARNAAPSPLLFQPEGQVGLPGAEQFFFSPHTWPANLSDSASIIIKRLFEVLHQRGKNHITVEGGATTLSLFLKSGLWDEARVFTGTGTYFGEGKSIELPPGPPHHRLALGADRLERWFHPRGATL